MAAECFTTFCSASRKASTSIVANLRAHFERGPFIRRIEPARDFHWSKVTRGALLQIPCERGQRVVLRIYGPDDFVERAADPPGGCGELPHAFCAVSGSGCSRAKISWRIASCESRAPTSSCMSRAMRARSPRAPLRPRVPPCAAPTGVGQSCRTTRAARQDRRGRKRAKAGSRPKMRPDVHGHESAWAFHSPSVCRTCASKGSLPAADRPFPQREPEPSASPRDSRADAIGTALLRLRRRRPRAAPQTAGAYPRGCAAARPEEARLHRLAPPRVADRGLHTLPPLRAGVKTPPGCRWRCAASGRRIYPARRLPAPHPPRLFQDAIHRRDRSLSTREQPSRAAPPTKPARRARAAPAALRPRDCAARYGRSHAPSPDRSRRKRRRRARLAADVKTYRANHQSASPPGNAPDARPGPVGRGQYWSCVRRRFPRETR